MLCVLAGCGNRTETQGSVNHAITSMESTPVIDYKVPEQTANILVDTLGYQTGSRKEAAIKGRTLPESFRVIDAGTHQPVFEGEIDRITYNAEMNLYTGYARFDDLNTDGKYYIECDMIGQSYPFEIREDLYLQLFDRIYSEMVDKCDDRTLSLQGAIALLTAYEWYGDQFRDEDGDQIPDVLTSLSGWMEAYEEKAGDENRMLRTALLAKYSYLYQNYDRRYATSCLQRATGLYESAQNTLQKDAEYFFAVTELYRATGLYTYRVQIEDYAGFFANSGSYLDEPEYLYGIMTYLVTRQKVDVDFCENLMKILRKKGEEISSSYEDIIHPVSARNNGSDDVLHHLRELLFLNYVSDSYRYYNIDKDFLHYLAGRNLQSVCFFEADDHEGYILLLAQLAAQKQ